MGKDTFFSGQPVFSQLLSLIPKDLIARLSREHSADRYYKSFMAYDHLVTMLYACYFQCTSLREVVTGLKANASRLVHLGLKDSVERSTLSDANAKRPVEFFADLFHALYRLHFSPDSRYKTNEEKLYIIDSSTISLFSSIMKGAGTPRKDGKKKGGAKAHVMMDSKHDIPAFVDITEARRADISFLKKLHVPDESTVVMDKAYLNYSVLNDWTARSIRWITRIKTNAYREETACQMLSEESRIAGVTSDTMAVLGRPSNLRQNPQMNARIIGFHDKEKDRHFQFLTNDYERIPEEIAMLYKRRWQIEILFKRIKQRYPLRYFLGDNENAIKIQIWSALICDLLVLVVQKQIKKNGKRWAYANVSSMIKHHLMSYLNLREFLQNPDKLRPTVSESVQLQLFSRGVT